MEQLLRSRDGITGHHDHQEQQQQQQQQPLGTPDYEGQQDHEVSRCKKRGYETPQDTFPLSPEVDSMPSSLQALRFERFEGSNDNFRAGYGKGRGEELKRAKELFERARAGIMRGGSDDKPAVRCVGGEEEEAEEMRSQRELEIGRDFFVKHLGRQLLDGVGEVVSEDPQQAAERQMVDAAFAGVLVKKRKDG